MEEIRTKGRGGPEPNRELLAHIWIHLSSTKNLGHPLKSFTLGRNRSWGSQLNFLLIILTRTLPWTKEPTGGDLRNSKQGSRKRRGTT